MNFCACRRAVLGFCVVFSTIHGRAQQTVTTPGGTTGYVPRLSGGTTVVNSEIFDTGKSVGIGVGKTPSSGAKLDVGGSMIVRGNMMASRTADATSSKGYPSWGFEFFANAYNSSTKVNDNPYFTLQSEPTGNNTASPSATFNLLFSNNGAASAETGFYINANGTLHFASAQTFPIPSGAQGPAGPAGPAGPKGATGAAGPAGTITVPYSASADGAGRALFTLVNTGTAAGSGLMATGAQSMAQQFDAGGVGLVGTGGNSDTSLQTHGGDGVIGQGGTGENAQSTGGRGGVFEGGFAYKDGGGGDGIDVFAGESTLDGQGGVGIYASSGSTGVYAGSFHGDVEVTGNISKAGGSFKIDHPLDPANKYLSHSFVESPDMMNIYNGNVVTDGRGEATVTLPEWFSALNRDFRYQLTAIGQHADCWVATEIADGKFTIASEKANVKVSWMVTGIRQDAWANAHRIPVEEDKPELEKGHYSHPELYGHGGERSIAEIRRGRPRASAER